MWLDTRILILTSLYMIGIKGDRLIGLMGLNRLDLLPEQHEINDGQFEGGFSNFDLVPTLRLAEDGSESDEPPETKPLQRAR